MSNEFDATDASMKLIPTLGQAFQDAAFAQADEFINAGQTVREASSIVAYLLIEAAWVVAGCGVLADGKKPDPNKFRAAVEATLQRIAFKDPDANVSKGCAE